MADINYADLGQKVTEMINSGASTESVPVPETVVDPTSQQQNTSVNADGQQQPTPPVNTPSSDDTSAQGTPQEQPKTYEVDFGNGRVETLTAAQIKELHESGLRQADYTKKTQELANERKQVEGIKERIQQVVSNPQWMLQLAQQQLAAQQQQQQQQIDPNQPVSFAAAQQMQQQLQEQTARYVQDQLATAKYAENINDTLGGLFKSHPVLTVNPENEDIIRYRVAQQMDENTTLPQAQALFKAEAEKLAKAYDEFYTQRSQQAEAQRAQLAKTGTESPGGAAPQPTKPSYVTNGKVDWAKLAKAAEASIQ